MMRYDDAESVAQVLHQRQHAGRGRDVEPRRRLVGDDQRRLEGQGPGDAHPPRLTARQLVRELVGELGPTARPARAARRPARAGIGMPVDHVRLGEQIARRACAATGCRSGPGGSSASATAAVAARGGRAMRRSVPSKLDLAAGRLGEPHQRQGERRLARAGLADQPDDLAPVELEVDAVDGAHRPRLDPPEPIDERAPHLEVLRHARAR